MIVYKRYYSILKKVILAVFIIFAPVSVFACIAPSVGEYFNKLIQVKRISKNVFRIKVAKKAKGLNFGANISVEYYKNGKKYSFDKYIRTLEIIETGKYYTSTFDLKKIAGYTPFVQVFWNPSSPGMCGAYGRSEDLLLE